MRLYRVSNQESCKKMIDEVMQKEEDDRRSYDEMKEGKEEEGAVFICCPPAIFQFTFFGFQLFTKERFLIGIFRIFPGSM